MHLHAKHLTATLSVAACALGIGLDARADDAPAPAPTTSGIQEVVVTAQKRTEDLKDVPAGISVIGGAALEGAHISGYEDLTRAVPSVSFASGGAGIGVGEGQANIEIRGVSSSSGSATVGVYLDETPITVDNNTGLGSTQPMPIDIDHVEVLRGPQGTLYGASSEGGTVRFIYNQPNLDDFEAKISSDLSGTLHGGVNYQEVGIVNIPIVPGTFAIRGNVEYGDDSGWIDNYSRSGVLEKTGVNDVRSGMIRLEALAKLTDDLTITPELYYQRYHVSDSPVFDLQDQSYAASDSFAVPPPVSSDGLYREHKGVDEYSRDTVFVPSLKVDYNLGGAQLTSVSSYFWRQFDRVSDGTTYNSYFIASYLDETNPEKTTQNNNLIGTLASPTIQPVTYGTVSEEIRLSSPDSQAKDLPLRWVAGLFYSDQWYSTSEYALVPGLSKTFQSIYGYGINSASSAIGDPAIPGMFGDDAVYYESGRHDVRQYAGFGQIDFDILPQLHGSAGIRYVYSRTAETANANGFFALGDSQTLDVDKREYDATPKFSLTYDLSDTSTAYATAAKGFRLGGALNVPLPTGAGNVCQADYDYLGIKSPSNAYGADKVWSYEAGTKSVIADRTLSINAAVYYINWSNIQQTITLPFCGYPDTLNVGDAESYGAEIEMLYRPRFAPGLTLGFNGNVGHADITRTNNPKQATVGESVLFTPDWSASFNAEYNWPINDTMVGFVRTDYDWTGRSHGSYIETNPGYSNHQYGVLGGSVGVDTGTWEVMLYGKNLANDHTIIQSPSINNQVTGYALQPLTVGVKVTRSF